MQARIKQNINAFDLLMRGAQDFGEHRDKAIPEHCTPAAWTSKFGQRLSSENRRASFGSSPCLSDRLSKRGADHVDSPTSPAQTNDNKKNRSENQASTASPHKTQQ